MIEKPLPVKETRYANPATICHGQQIGDCIRSQRDSESKPILDLGDSNAANQAVQKIVTEFLSAQFWEFTNLELFATPPMYQGNLIYHDNHHLNEKGAVLYGAAVTDIFAIK